MKMKEPVVIYGASGYTGKLISWHLARAKIPFIAAGRNLKRLEEQMKLVPELVGASYSCAECPPDEAALTKLFKGSKIVYNVAGPFMPIAGPVARAALAAGCHYLDTTGETDWMRYLRDTLGADFKKAGLLLAPATSWMWTAGLLAAEIALETPGVDSLDLLYIADSATSVGSTQSFLRMCTNPQYFIQNRQLVMWPYATAYQALSPDSHRVFQSLPWSGSGECVWYEGDSRVSNCATLIAFRNDVMFGAVLDALKDFEKKARHLPVEQHEKITLEMAGGMVTEEPGREDPNCNRAVISCIGRGNTSGVKVVLRTTAPYFQTGLIASEACRRILDGRLLATGFQSPAKAFGARPLLAAMAELGYHTWNAQQTV